MQANFISIIIPCFNSQKHIASCLNNVLQQTYIHKEIIVVDGGSTDETISIVRQFANNNKTIKWISEKDNGVYDAMNKGISLSKGNWLFFLGTDDRFYSHTIVEDVFKEIQLLKNTSFIYGNVEFLYSKQVYNGEFNLHRILFGGNICHQSIFYHKSVFEKIGHFDINCKIYADHDFNIQCFFSKKIKTKFINKIIAIYNESDGLSAIDKTDLVFRKKQEKYILQYYQQPLPFIKNKIQQCRSFAKKVLQKIKVLK